MIISGNIVDVLNRRIFKGRVIIGADGKIESLEESTEAEEQFIIPPFVDSHVHIESSMMMPSEFAGLAVRHGVTAALCDPHEIANVLGVQGIDLMIENGKESPFRFFFGASSCVPATPFETSGAVMDASVITKMLAHKEVHFLAEMMNYPGVIEGEPEVLEKLAAAANAGKPVDGHAPALRGEDLKKYIKAGITTDHESVTLDEAKEKISFGMKILIREGSAAKFFDELHSLIDDYSDMVMLCTDDCHPDELAGGYINSLVKRAVGKGHNVFNVLKAASVNPVLHYGLPAGLLRIGDPADFIVVNNLSDFAVLQTYINGTAVYDNGKLDFVSKPIRVANNFEAQPLSAGDIEVLHCKGDKIRVIEIADKSLITKQLIIEPKINEKGKIVSDTERDILKIVVLNRYSANAKPAVGFIKNFGLKRGALCSTISHDSHNIIAVGVSDKEILAAVNEVISFKGGICVADGEEVIIMPLSVGGIVSGERADEVIFQYNILQDKVKTLGTKLSAPFMTLSFMALIVIPELKICDRGLFDVLKFESVGLFTK